MIDKSVERKERFDFLVSCLESHSGVFAQFAETGRVYFSEQIETACVTFDKEGNHLNFQWNPHFFDSNSNYTNLFIFCHEMLHILLGHGPRGRKLKNRRKANICMDISINHMLVDVFGFCRAHIDDWEKLCWRDTVFNRDFNPMPSFEGYYNISDEFFNKGYDSMEEHNFLEEDFPDISDLQSNMLEEIPSCGDGAGEVEELVKAARNKKKKFETLVKNLTSTMRQKSNSKEDYSWATIDRRLSYIAPDLPAYSTVFERSHEDRYRCAFFLDNSGSCGSFVKRFCEVAAGLNEKVFEVDIYCFDTRVHKVERTKDGFKIVGGGGTAFGPVIRKIEEEDPDIVFILTDGEAGAVENKLKRKTHWFLTENGRANAISGAGSVWRLSQFS